MFDTRAEIMEALEMPMEEFRNAFLIKAGELYRDSGRGLVAVAMLGYSNICRSQCLYCGMRAGNSSIPRYRFGPPEALKLTQAGRDLGFGRLFLISGEDMGYGFENLLALVSGAKDQGYRQISLACGEFTLEQYRQLREAGADEYVMKFEMSDAEDFNRLNPSTDFSRRMEAIEAVKKSGMKLASGNIVDYPGHTLHKIADDIELMRKLEISWAPVVPYMPAPNTPLALEGGRGSLELILREIAILRLMMPQVNITAGQPGEDPKNGFGDRQGNLNAIGAGANVLFADLLPVSKADAFFVVENRNLPGLQQMEALSKLSGLQLSMG